MPERITNRYRRIALLFSSLAAEFDQLSSEFGPLTNNRDARLNEIGNLPIEELELSVRALNTLHNSSIDTIAQLSTMKRSALSRCKNCGPRTVREITETMQNIGLPLER